jgi:hypothetical protein
MIKSRLAAAAAGVLAAGATLAIAAPAMALNPLPPTCVANASPPPQYSAPCTPVVSPSPPVLPGTVTLTMPGVGSIMINVDSSGNVTVPTPPSPQGQFKVGVLTVNNNTGVVSVTFTNKGAAGVVNPETYVIKAKVSALPGGGFAVTKAIAKPVGHHHHDDEGQGDDKQGDDDSQGGAGGHDAALAGVGGAGGLGHGGEGGGGQD